MSTQERKDRIMKAIKLINQNGGISIGETLSRASEIYATCLRCAIKSYSDSPSEQGKIIDLYDKEHQVILTEITSVLEESLKI